MKEEALVRLGCYRQAIITKHRFSGLPQTESVIADNFAGFCVGDEMRLAALELAVERSGRRFSVADTLDAARAYVDFAVNRKKVPAGGKTFKRKTRSR